MRFRYPIITGIILFAAMLAATASGGNVLIAVAGFWLACLTGIMAVLDNEMSGPSPSSLVHVRYAANDKDGDPDGFAAAA